MDNCSIKSLAMAKQCLLIGLTVVAMGVMACGPETIFLRPALDTPARHVENGHLLLSRGKIDAADAEFSRAKSLDHAYVPAHVGLALIQGHRGDIHSGLKMLDQAKVHATTPAEINAVNDGYEQLKRMRAVE